MIKPKKIVTYSYFGMVCWGAEYSLNSKTGEWTASIKKVKIMSIGQSKNGKLKCFPFYASKIANSPLYFEPKDLYETEEELKEKVQSKLIQLNAK